MDLDQLLDGLRDRAAHGRMAPDPSTPERTGRQDPGSSPDSEETGPRDPVRAGRPRLAALRGVMVDPGRRGARAMALAAAAAAVVTGAWVLVDSPGGRSSSIDRGATLTAAPVVVGGTARPSSEPALPAASSTAASPSSADLVVDVAGQVASPGVYRLPVGSRVIDAITAAGGAAPGADLSALNLARKVQDGEQIAVAVPGAGPTAAAPASPGGAGAVINLNTATLADLDSLPGIGAVLAQNILDWRAANGRFEAVDQLREVSGIGEAKYAQLKSRVAV